jgi:hypothetical protein
MKPSDLLESMIAAGATPEACVIALRAIEARDDADAERRAKAAERKRRQRDAERDAAVTVTGQSRDKSVTTQGQRSAKEKSPHTPLKENNPPIVPPSGDVFEDFWRDYPRKQGTSKANARKAFDRLEPDEQKQAVAALAEFARSVAQTEERYIPHAATWLNQRRFETVAEQKPTGDPVLWRLRLERLRDSGYWDAWLGPRPGMLGCECPEDLQREFGHVPRPITVPP